LNAAAHSEVKGGDKEEKTCTPINSLLFACGITPGGGGGIFWGEFLQVF